MGRKIVYHDGLQYAQALVKHGFSNIQVIPDATAATFLFLLLERRSARIDFVMVGANGFDEEHFLHSAGHAMVVAVKNLPGMNLIMVRAQLLYYPSLLISTSGLILMISNRRRVRLSLRIDRGKSIQSSETTDTINTNNFSHKKDLKEQSLDVEGKEISVMNGSTTEPHSRM